MKLTEKEYYTAPSDEIFEDIKQACITVWQAYDDTYNYVSGKVDSIGDLKNISDNYAFMIAMFDIYNQIKVRELLLRDDSKQLVNKLVNY